MSGASWGREPPADPGAASVRALLVRGRHRRGGWIALGIGGILVIVAVVLAAISVPYYAITPGQGLNVRGLITVPAAVEQHHRGAVLLTDVEVQPLRALTYLYYRYLDSEAAVEPNADIIGVATPTQYAEQGVIDMGGARQAAAVDALQALGYPTRAKPSGVIVYQPFPGSPAAHVLAVGEVVTALDAQPTPTSAALDKALAHDRPGEVVHLTYHRYVARSAVTALVAPSPSSEIAVRLGAVAGTEDGIDDCVAYNASELVERDAHACLGVESGLYEVEQEFETLGAPFPVTIDADGIDGPSAGLAFTLGLIEKLDHDDLTGGRRIAATGTIAIGGAVGDVGGVAEKTIAVRNAGATVFLVPPEEYGVARAHAGSTLRVYKVASLAAAISVLEHLGGRIAPRQPAANAVG